MFARAVTSTLVILAASCYRATAYQSPIPIEKLVTSYGYHLSSHDVVTPDGYILTMHRVSKPDAANTPSHSSPVILGHGLTTNSEQWLFRDDQSLVYLLVDNGFDVWLGNFRGSNHGRRHLTLSPQSHEFWDFSWHENGLIDQAAFIDHVLNVTGHERLFTVSFSMSCTASMVLLSERPEYASKIIVNVFLAPPAFFRHPSGLWRLSKLIIDIFPRLIKDATGPNIVNDKLPFSDTPFGILCLSGNRNNLFTPICKWSAEFFAGKTSGFLSNKLMGLLFERTPAGASIRQMTHFGQSLLGGGFRKYDYGMAKNLELYGSRVPPSYNLTAITSPIDFYYGLADSSVSAKDAEDLSKLIPSIVSVHEVPKFNHFDFLFSAYLDEAVNKKILATFSSYL